MGFESSLKQFMVFDSHAELLCNKPFQIQTMQFPSSSSHHHYSINNSGFPSKPTQVLNMHKTVCPLSVSWRLSLWRCPVLSIYHKRLLIVQFWMSWCFSMRKALMTSNHSKTSHLTTKWRCIAYICVSSPMCCAGSEPDRLTRELTTFITTAF